MVSVVALNGLPAQPWKNGAGTTRMLAEGAGWRVSLARVERNGPFSVFEATRRHSIVVDGDGLNLHCADTTVVMQPNELSSYPGGLAWDCRLKGRAATVLNIMCGEHVADVDIFLGRQVRLAPRDGDTTLVLPMKGAMTCRPDVAAPFVVAPGHVLVARDVLGINCQVAGSKPHSPAWLVAIRLHSYQRPLC